jgi:hypothetical protein
MTGGTQQDSAQTTCSPVPTTNRRECLDASTSTCPLLPLANSSDQSSSGAISRKISVITALSVRSSSPSRTKTRSSTTSGLPPAPTPVGQSETYTARSVEPDNRACSAAHLRAAREGSERGIFLWNFPEWVQVVASYNRAFRLGRLNRRLDSPTQDGRGQFHQSQSSVGSRRSLHSQSLGAHATNRFR